MHNNIERWREIDRYIERERKRRTTQRDLDCG